MTEHAIPTRTVRRGESGLRTVEADLCVLGAGISGVSAALEGAKLGKKVVLVDGAPAVGGQAIGSIIGTIIGLYSHGRGAYQLTHGIADELIADLTAEGSLLRLETSTVLFQYDEVRLGRWMDRKLQEAGVHVLVGAVLTHVERSGRRLLHADFATRFGAVRVAAQGYVEASGDAALCFAAGLEVREPEAPVYGSLNFLIEGYDPQAVAALDMEAVRARLRERGARYGLVRHDGWLMPFPSKGLMLANINHIETPLDPLGAAQMVFEGRRQADAVVEFLKAEFPDIFANARVRAYGNPGIRQTRWIVSRRQLTIDDLRRAERPADAVARCAWHVELHDTAETVYWERFPDGHVYYIPLSCMTPREVDNVVAAGRCIDADTQALSAVRVMGPCIAMGTAAAHALALAGNGAVADVDLAALQRSLADNLDRCD
ncbi:MAG TPA: FAD-dependent oxidoreductase [Gammaproteobacteria bacterium]